jgi:hypothetical protein
LEFNLKIKVQLRLKNNALTERYVAYQCTEYVEQKPVGKGHFIACSAAVQVERRKKTNFNSERGCKENPETTQIPA